MSKKNFKKKNCLIKSLKNIWPYKKPKKKKNKKNKGQYGKPEEKNYGNMKKRRKKLPQDKTIKKLKGHINSLKNI